MNVPATIAAETAIARQNVALSTIKHNAEQAQKVAEILQESATTVASLSNRGIGLDIRA